MRVVQRLRRVLRGRSARSSAGLLLALAVSACTPPPQACQLYMATSVPLTPIDDGTALVVPATLGTRPLSLVVDTGSDTTTLTDKAVTDSAQFTQDDHSVTGIGGDRIAAVAILNKLQLGRLHGDIDADVLNFDLVEGGRPRDGLLGMNLLGAYDVDIDIPGRELRFYVARGDCAAPSAALTPPLYTVAEIRNSELPSSPTVKVTIHGKVFTAVIDTGSTDTSLFSGAARSLGLVGPAVADDPTATMTGVGRRKIEAHVHTLDEITIGDLQLRNVPVALLDQDSAEYDLLLGMDFVNRAHLWLSRSSHTLIMQVPPLPSPPVAGAP